MDVTKTNPGILRTRQHFEILDGLRGIAAVAVVIFHFMEFAVPDYSNNFIAHSYLAVDFFFCLSGFVIAYAYDSKVEKLGAFQFIKLRLIRLHPLVIIGSVLGLLCFIFDPFSNLHTAYSAGNVFLMFLSSCFLIPYPIVHERYFNLFHLNPPTWSLFWEYIANLFYVLILYKLRNRILWFLVAIAAIALCYESYYSGYLGVGWGGDNFWGGGVRIFFSFLAGMLVYRSNWIIRSRLGFVFMGILLAIVFLVPFSDKANRITDPVIVIFYLPFLIALGAGAHLTNTYSRICKFFGDISYPLYMIHYPFLWIFLSYVEVKKPGMSQMEIIIPMAVVLLIGLAFLVMTLLDMPIHRDLKNRMDKKLR
ncbi:acyltransferase family protein [Mucilaginibacter sp. SP1R1]|uniref:acyltransferase family protein n=1 Tax=Mucilaginibacter sp. SP1R1 TaxID=2723091 RepID=UPI001616E460|nr:acyltransferase [Mucilaginibacter sp. SP1R1]MBB6150160.1 peptidoglycan/LPS O-acetylase OafA/YrhL [Mucilaginibacter sp. SP1R1]